MGNEQIPRQLRLLEGETKLRKHLPDNVALTVHLLYAWGFGKWMVRVKIFPENGGPIEFGDEPLDTFPSDALIAQAVLVS